MGSFLRAAAGTVLGLLVFACLLVLLVVVNVTQRLDDPEVYAAAFGETGAYARIYDQVLADEALADQAGRLMGDVELGDHARVVELLRDIMPPQYLREQVEANVDRFTAYLRHERDALEIYVDLEVPLERVEPAALEAVDRLVDDLEIVQPEASGCSPAALEELAAASAGPYSQLAQGRLPDSAPSLEILSRECREEKFDPWFGLLLDDPAIGEQASRILGDEVETLRDSFIEGDSRGFLKAAAGPLVGPVVGDALTGLEEQLPPDGRVDLLEWLDTQPGGPSRQDIERRAGSLREALTAANGPGRVIALLLVVVGSLLLALVHLPNPAGMLRWPGITLLAAGAVCLVLGFVLNAMAPGMAGDAVASMAPLSPAVPAPAITLASDLAESLVRQATGGFLPLCVAAMALGGALVAASPHGNRLSAWVGRSRSGGVGRDS